MLHPVIMAGGMGTRFWPRSRRNHPKQLIQIFGDGTMVQQTVARVESGFPAGSILIITHRDQAEEMRRQLPQLQPEQVVAEPCGRDTAACIGLAAFMLRRTDPDGAMAVLSADHVIEPAEAFVRCVNEAADLAAQRHVLVTFGVRPSEPSDLFGYIRRGEPLPGVAGAYRIAEFIEKPTRARAEEFLRAGRHYWNSGNFVWCIADIIAAIREFLPDLHAGLSRIEPALGAPRQGEALEREYPALQKISIDYGVMEKASNAVVMEARFEWDDVGSWESVARHQKPDAQGNVVMGDHAGLDTANCIVVGEPGHLIATIGVENLIIVQTPDATLVCDRRRASSVKALVDFLKKRRYDAHL